MREIGSEDGKGTKGTSPLLKGNMRERHLFILDDKYMDGLYYQIYFFKKLFYFMLGYS